MSNDLQLFNEDATEQLNFMELALIHMQEDGVNEEDIGAVFRAMHTIKGTAGMFGFVDVVGFTHIAENLLSEVRDGHVTLGEELIEFFLLVKDHAEHLIQVALNDESMSETLRQNNDALITSLISYMPVEKQQELHPTVSITKEKSAASTSNIESNEHIITWHISIRFVPEFFGTGMDILSILNFLNIVGKVTKLVAVIDGIPPLEEINPVEASIGFEIQLEMSDTGYDEILEVFEFVLDDLDLSIFKASDAESLQKLVTHFNNNEHFKELLIKNGFFTKDQVNGSKESLESFPEKNDTEEIKTTNSSPQSIVSSPVSIKTSEIKKTDISANKSFSLRVDSSKVDQLINQISEMVIANAKIAQRADIVDDTELSESAIMMSDMLEQIRTGVMNIRMVQVGDTFSKFKRIVNDATKSLGKEIHFTIDGEETELDKMVVEKISDPIMHMLRNSVDHGIEMPQKRIAKGKTSSGNISLSTYPDAGTIVIEIKDDGKGLDKEAILKKAVANHLVLEEQTLSDKEIYNLIFAAGLSTAKEVSNISGRGVGMDVVRRNIDDLRGTITIESEKDVGTKFVIRLPLTLAIIDGFLIQSGKTKYIIPLEMIQECIELDRRYKEKMHGNQFINLRDSILPLLDVREYFQEEESETFRENVVIVKYADYKMGIKVDELYGQFQTVIKPIGEVFSKVPGISGGTILGSGEIALIFDIPKLMDYRMKQEEK